MTKRSIVQLVLAGTLGVSYALYYLSRGAGPGAWVVGIVAALVAAFIAQTWLPPSGGTRD